MTQRSSACHAAITQPVSDGIVKGRQSTTMGRHSNGKALRFKVKSAGWGVGLSQGCVGCMVSLLILPIGGWLAAIADLWLVGMAIVLMAMSFPSCWRSARRWWPMSTAPIAEPRSVPWATRRPG